MLFIFKTMLGVLFRWIHFATYCCSAYCLMFFLVNYAYELCPPDWEVDILFLLFPSSGVRDAWFPVISRKSIYPIFTKFCIGVYWVNSLHGIAFGEDSSIAN